jgi:hypothetical protein
MFPLPAEILRGVLENLDEIVFPQVQDAHGGSVAKCSRMLIKHVILRLENEPQMLAADSAEKRELLAVLAAESASSGNEQLVALGSQIATVLDEATPGPEAGLAAQTAGNDRLKAAFDTVLIGIGVTGLDSSWVEKARDRLRNQMRAQMNRELALVAGAFGAEHPF